MNLYNDGMNMTREEKDIMIKRYDEKGTNLIGQKFNHLTVIDIDFIDKNNKVHWLCKCDCENGGIRSAITNQLKSGEIKSCKLCSRSKGPKLDLIGKQFGHIKVIGFDHIDHKKRLSYWKCTCDCDESKIHIIQGSRLMSGEITHCKDSIHRVKDLTGQEFGRLKVIKLDHVGKPGDGAFWLCSCTKPGKMYPHNYKVIRGRALITGNTRSCGCLDEERDRKIHGETGTRLYHIWNGMKDRCNNPNNINYKNYGGRGIKVCPEWNAPDGYLAFKRDMGPTYQDGLSINRIDNDGDYCKENCNWITMHEQQFNKQNTVLINYFGKDYALGELSEKFVEDKYDILARDLIESRIKAGWSVEEAVKIPNLDSIGTTKDNYLKTHKVIKKPICFDNEDPFDIPDVVKLSDIINIKEE